MHLPDDLFPLEYRAEEKFICNEGDMLSLQNRLSAVMKSDGNGEKYLVRSLYFDDLRQSALCDTLSGTDDRVKYRIRTYNGDKSVIKLEAKEKKHGFTRKQSCEISFETASKLISCELVPISGDIPDVLNRFLIETRLAMMRPCIVVEYERQAFVNEAGNVRITFDRAVSSANADRFWDSDIEGHSPICEPLNITEIKYDGVLPSHIRQLCENGHMRKTSFSKYAICAAGTVDL